MQSQLKILFVDDHSGLRDGISFLLSKENSDLQFFNASTKDEALEILKNNSDIKNAILDININGEIIIDLKIDVENNDALTILHPQH